MKKYKIFVACDNTNISKVKKIINDTKTLEIKIGYKFGLEFLNSKYGRSYISKLKNKIIFADLKLHDIPNTCASTIKAIKDLKVDYLTIHISAGLEALKAAKKVSGKIKLIGVTTLTSLDNKSLKEIGYKKNINELVIHQSKLALKANLDAIVCSPHEVKLVRKFFKKEIITPGIRLKGDDIGDQKRVTRPKEAFKNGSTGIILGRSITIGNVKNNMQRLIEELK